MQIDDSVKDLNRKYQVDSKAIDYAINRQAFIVSVLKDGLEPPQRY